MSAARWAPRLSLELMLAEVEEYSRARTKYQDIASIRIHETWSLGYAFLDALMPMDEAAQRLIDTALQAN